MPASVAHIARDLLDPRLDLEAVVVRLRARRTGLKRALLDQTLVSGIGNIYADEALWRARLHGARPTETLTRPEARRVLGFAREVMLEALGEGGTSFDRLYVDVNGASGYFDRSLAAYGQEGEPCPRCGTPIRREAFMNRSSFSCPRCQPRPAPGRSGETARPTRARAGDRLAVRPGPGRRHAVVGPVPRRWSWGWPAMPPTWPTAGSRSSPRARPRPVRGCCELLGEEPSGAGRPGQVTAVTHRDSAPRGLPAGFVER